MKRERIAFLGLFGQGNLGNECTLQAILYNARKYLPDAEVHCICSGPEDASVRHNVCAFPMEAVSGSARQEKGNLWLGFIRKLFIRITKELLHGIRAFKALRGTHTVVAAGTGLLVDHTTGFRGYPYYVFKWSLIARLCGCRVLVVSMGAGPISHPVSRLFIKSALSMAAYRSYRDSDSKELIGSIGVDTNNDPVYPDLAFSLPEAMVAECDSPLGKRPVIGVGVVDYYGPSGKIDRERESIYREYLEKMVSFVAWLLQHDYSVRLLIGDVKYDSSVRRDLMDFIEKRGVKYEAGRVVSESIDSVEELTLQLAKIDIVISPRFHNLILALMLNKPVISLSHHNKFDSLMSGFGLGEYSLPIEDLDVERLIEQFIKLGRRGEELTSHIKRKTEEYRKDLDRQYSMIFRNSSTDLPVNMC
jgi:polysaccharide pyruvyl transferase WcaK-like protein